MRRLFMIALAFATILIHAQQPPPPADAPLPLDQWLGKGINPPKPLNEVVPRPPDELFRKLVTGPIARCLVLWTVDVNGMPQDIQLVRSTNPVFGKFCLDVIAKSRFSPATTQDGKAVSVKTSSVQSVKIEGALDPAMPIRYAFRTPSGITSSEPGADGVYPFTKLATPPSITKFSDQGYGDLAFSFVGNSVCTVALTISAKGKPSDPQVIHCERPNLEEPAVKSLLKSQFKPGKVNGKAVPMRASIQIELGDFPSN